MQIRGTWPAGPGDDQARFLADLRALRDSAAIGYDEMAARAHYPSNVLKEAENGPSLPGLPILTAYVRACEGDVLDWEERWRRLNPEVAEDPGLPVRPAGASAAAMAGARAGVSVAPPDVYDPERIKAALRGDRSRTEQTGRRPSDLGLSAAGVADRLVQDQPADSGVSLDSAADWEAGPGWDQVADPGVTSTNGSPLADNGSRGPFEAAFPGAPDPAEPGQTGDFAWLKKSTPEPRPAEPAPEPAVGLAAEERTDFWSKPVASVPSDPQRPTAAPRADELAIERASWPAPADTATEPAQREAATPAQREAATTGQREAATVSGSTQPHGPVSSAAQLAAGDRNDRRKDRLFPIRVLVVIVIAALIGSALVLLLK